MGKSLDLLHSISPRPGVNLIEDAPIDLEPTVASLRTLGTGAQQAMAGNDSRITAAAGVLNYAAARLIVGTVGQTIAVAGRVTAGDGCQGAFVWKAGIATDDDGSILQSTGGYWERADTKQIDPRWWGAKLNNIDDDAVPIQKAIDFASTVGGYVYLTGSGARVSSALLAKSYVRVFADRQDYTITQTTARTPVLSVRSGVVKPVFERIKFKASVDSDAVEVVAQTPGSGVDRPRFIDCTMDVQATVNKSCTADNTTDFITCASHGYVNGDRVMFTASSGGAVPTGLTNRIRYYVVGRTANAFQVSLTKGGAAVNFTTDGTNVKVCRIVGAFALYPTNYDIYFPQLDTCDLIGSFNNSATAGVMVWKDPSGGVGGAIGVLLQGGWIHNHRVGYLDNNSSGSYLVATEFDACTDPLGTGGGTYVLLEGIATQNTFFPRFEPPPTANDYVWDAAGTFYNRLMGCFDGLACNLVRGNNTIDGFDGSTHINVEPNPTIFSALKADSIAEATTSARTAFPNGLKVDVNAPPSGIFDLLATDILRVTKSGGTGIPQAYFSDGAGGYQTIGFDDANNVGFLNTTGDAIYFQTSGGLRWFLTPGGLLGRSSLQEYVGSAVASATTIIVPTDGNTHALTGVTTVDHIRHSDWQGGSEIVLCCPSGLTMRHNIGAPPANYAGVIMKAGVDKVIPSNGIIILKIIKGSGLPTAWYEV